MLGKAKKTCNKKA